MRHFANLPLTARAEPLWSQLGIMTGLGAVLALLGPFQTYEASLFERLGFWMALSGLWFAILTLVGELVDRRLFRLITSDILRFAVKILVSGLPMVMVVMAAIDMLFGEELGPMSPVALYSKTLLIGLLLTAVSGLVLRGATARVRLPFGAERVVAKLGPPMDTKPVPAIEPERTAIPELAERLPHPLPGPILCLEMEDHYVRVHAEGGSALVLMRMTDAAELMGPDAGLRVHRSWWVSSSAVTALSRKGRQLMLELANGLSVPVSQSYAQQVRERFGRP